MANQHYIRVGTLGQVGRFDATSGERFARGHRVVCRTRRGLEVGEVLKAPQGDEAYAPSDGAVLRRVTPEDDLLLARLERDRQAAFEACARLITERKLAATLIDVEHLFDGQSLYFYFLGEVTPEIDALTQDLAAAYEAKVQFRQFADALEHGCGPDCGTEAGGGCGTEAGCASCSIASACRT